MQHRPSFLPLPLSTLEAVSGGLDDSSWAGADEFDSPTGALGVGSPASLDTFPYQSLFDGPAPLEQASPFGSYFDSFAGYVSSWVVRPPARESLPPTGGIRG